MEFIRLKRSSGDVVLSTKEIDHIIVEWYTNGMFSDFLQDEDGRDLEEILDIDYSVKVETIRDDE